MSARPPYRPKRNHFKIAGAIVGVGLLIGGAKLLAYWQLQMKPHMDRMAYLKANEPEAEELTDAQRQAEAASVRYLTADDKRRMLGRVGRTINHSESSAGEGNAAQGKG